MSDEIETPRRGYDTKDVETMSRELEATGVGATKKWVVLAVLVVAAGAALWLIGR
jgi:hypothetical protein